jgi:hypothetical protein
VLLELSISRDTVIQEFRCIFVKCTYCFPPKIAPKIFDFFKIFNMFLIKRLLAIELSNKNSLCESFTCLVIFFFFVNFYAEFTWLAAIFHSGLTFWLFLVLETRKWNIKCVHFFFAQIAMFHSFSTPRAYYSNRAHRRTIIV